MKVFKLISLLAIVSLYTSYAYSQEIKTKLLQQIRIDRGFNQSVKLIETGDSVTVFAYKKKDDRHYFGIYTNDYADIINLKDIPFDLQPKQLKKLPNALNEEGKIQLNIVRKNINEKVRSLALSEKYKVFVTGTFTNEQNHNTCSFNRDLVTIIGYKNSSVGAYCAIIHKDGAGIYKYYVSNAFNTVPLDYMPSTDDPEVIFKISSENTRITNEIAKKKKAREEEERRLAAIKKAHDDSIQAVKDSISLIEREKELADIKKELAKEMAAIRKLGPVLIKVTGWTMDSAGGITVSLEITNCTSQRIKYVTFKGYFLNAVGDKCRNEINGSTEWKGRGIGPIEAYPKTPEELVEGDKEYIANYDFEHASFYARTADTFYLSSVTIEYMNGKKSVLSGTELKKRVIYK